MVIKKIFKVTNILILMFLFSSCDENKINFNNFSFQYNDLSDSYDSKKGIFTRKYSDNEVKIKILLTEEDKKQIFRCFINNSFSNFPQEIDCSKWCVSPKHYDYLKVNNISVRYVYNGMGDEGLFCFNGKKFNKISSFIKEILLNKSEIKKLDPSDIFYE